MSTSSMTRSEQKSVFYLSAIYALRMLGLFMVLPVMMTYGIEIPQATPMLLGIAIGAYGLAQGILQVPFGFMSDKLGRKPVLVTGLLMFCLGSLIAAFAPNVYWLIFGRLLQGAGAIASALMALLSDLTREENRTKAMATIGMSIGISFSIALVLGPIIAGAIGLSGIFGLTAALALFGVFIVIWLVPTPVSQGWHRDTSPVKSQFKKALSNGELLRLNLGIFALHFVIVATFIAVPNLLLESSELDRSEHWVVYLPVLVISFIAMIPLIIIGEKRQKMKPILMLAIVLLIISQLGLAAVGSSFWGVVILLFVFFWGFNILEASLPSLVSKISPAGAKGTAMGVYSSCQFFGAFAGGSLGGLLVSHFGASGLFIGSAVLLCLWLASAVTMHPPKHLKGLVLNVQNLDKVKARQLSNQLFGLDGVEDVQVIPEESTAYLKVDSRKIDNHALERITALY